MTAACQASGADALLAGTSAAIAPARLADVFLGSGAVAIAELPWAAPATPVRMVWHNRLGHDPAHRWLRSQLEAAARPAG